MTQTVAAEAHLGPAHTGKTIEYRVLQIDGSTEDVTWTSTDVVETSVSGNYRVDNGVTVQDAGGFVEFRESGPDTVLATLPIDPAAPTAAQVSADILATILESGKSFQTFVIDLWAVVVGNAAADDAVNPTSITYDSPDDSVQVTHTLTSTTRSV